ncbi:MAG TPA: cytochrome c biogenesis protein CcsA [Bacteroidota bacterium]|nr:cytochrome c biogenesis protein CcsA [Bacteroidota bacterium]
MLGSLSLWVGFAAAVLSAVTYFRLATHRGGSPIIARRSFIVSVISVVAASLFLLYAILYHQFEFSYVWGYSSRSLPIELLITTFWAGQEGSFLFWTLCAVLIGVALQIYTRRKRIEYEVMAVYLFIVSFLLVLLTAKSPFQFIWEAYPDQIQPGTVPPDGRGLNPLLQNFWMIAHPPVMFVGFAALAVPFALAVAALWRRRYDEWVLPAFPWVLFGALSLGAGLILGGYWAYGVLGWGGWWGWDPVENSSLVPWIVVTMLLHTLLIQKKTGKLARTNFVLAILSFVLVVYSTFLTRSGILGESSVHSFVDPGQFVYLLLVAWIISMVGLGAAALSLRWKELKSQTVGVGSWTRESLLSLGVLALAFSALVILVGTSWPIFSQASVEPAFYDKTNLPIAIVLSLLLGVSLFTRWGEERREEIIRRSALALGVAIVGAAVLWVFGLKDIQMLIFATGALFVLAITVRLLIIMGKEDLKLIGAPLAHLGIAVMFLGIIGSGFYGQKVPTALRLNQPVSLFGYEVTYKGEERLPDGKSRFIVDVRKGATTFTLKPVMFMSDYNNSLMRNPDYSSSITEDFYIEPVSFEPAGHDRAEHSHSLFELRKGEMKSIGGYNITFERFDMSSHAGAGMAGGGSFAIGAVLKIEKGGKIETVTPITLYHTEKQPEAQKAAMKKGPLSFELYGLKVGDANEPSRIQINVLGLPDDQSSHTEAENPEQLVIEASLKPFINFVWIGALLILAGFGVALYRRSREEGADQQRRGKQRPERRPAKEAEVVETIPPSQDREPQPAEK